MTETFIRTSNGYRIELDTPVKNFIEINNLTLTYTNKQLVVYDPKTQKNKAFGTTIFKDKPGKRLNTLCIPGKTMNHFDYRLSNYSPSVEYVDEIDSIPDESIGDVIEALGQDISNIFSKFEQILEKISK